MASAAFTKLNRFGKFQIIPLFYVTSLLDIRQISGAYSKMFQSVPR